ncbi:hypothetical protein CPB84DRAFT_1829746 [Gymnopilus junonius]|uniref:Uncharacterized protein n=1 Tax=Gymnopilus junonius TaxID=109634 RepID=A0A9P5NAT4_GYMJU|nr:hypothetical protein CPB84DRAFT_1829746 [Gymnopilus junonius]
MLNAIPPPPRVDSDEYMYFYGFTFDSNDDFYQRVVDPAWYSKKGTEEPDTGIALRKLENITGVKMTLVEVYTDDDLTSPDTDILFMLAVASVSKEHPETSMQVTRSQLANIKKEGGFEGVEPKWLMSIWTNEELKKMPYPELV